MSFSDCSLELVTAFFALACLGPDGGNTARALRLVSRYCSAIATPLEPREISGQRQLARARARIELEQRRALAGLERAEVHHLFICDYTAAKAIALDVSVSGSEDDGRSVDNDDEEEVGVEEEDRHLSTREYRRAVFWTDAELLLQTVSASLRTLALVIFDPLELWGLSWPDKGMSVLSALHDIDLPRLRGLTVKHPGRIGNAKPETGQRWRAPRAPLLQRLTIINCCHLELDLPNGFVYALHPLLDGLHTHFPALTVLRLRALTLRSVGPLAAAICGTQSDKGRTVFVDGSRDGDGGENDAGTDTASSPEDCLANGRLPGKLRAVEVQLPIHPLERKLVDYADVVAQRDRDFAAIIDAHNVKGLHAYAPPRWPWVDETEYKLLLREWYADSEQLAS